MSDFGPHPDAERAGSSPAARLADLLLASRARRVAFLGIAKNVGKTTALLAALEELARRGVATGAVSAGRDGEAIDALTGEPKPRYRVGSGQLLASARSAFEAASFESTTLTVLPFTTRFGPIEVRRADAPGELEMIGPSTASEVAAACAELERRGAAVVLLDGALGRKAFASARVADAVVLSVGLAGAGSLEGAVQAARDAVEVVSLGAPENGRRRVEIDGALTETLAASLGSARGDVLVAEDFSAIFLSSATRRALAASGIGLAVRRPARLLAVTVNPTAPGRAPVSAATFLSSVRSSVPAAFAVLDLGPAA